MSSQRDLHCFVTGKTIRSQTKYVIINVWNYFDQEAKKSGCLVNLMEKVAKATGKTLSAWPMHTAPCFHSLL